MRIVEFCNSNSGFMDAILATLSLALSVIAVLISVDTANRQIQISLLENRLDVYKHIQKICSFIERFPVAAQNRPYIGKCTLASAFLYQVGSKEYNICKEINLIKKRAVSIEELEMKSALEKEWMDMADNLFEFCATETRNNSELQNNLHFLFDSNTEECVKKIIPIYEVFLVGHVYFNDAEFNSAIEDMIQVSNEVHLSSLLKNIEQQTLKRKQSIVFRLRNLFMDSLIYQFIKEKLLKIR